MAVTTFIPTVWDAALLQNFYENSKVSAVTFRPDKVEGNKIVFNRVSNINIKDYTGTVAWDSLTTSKVEMDLDQKKYWAFSVDDVDAIQAAGPLSSPHVIEASNLMAKTVDTWAFAKMATDGTNTLNLAAISSTNAYDKLVDLNRSLDKRNVPQNDRFLIINWDVLGMLEKDVRFGTENNEVLRNGLVNGRFINGAQIVVTNNLPNNKLFALQKSAFGFAMQLNETEAMRLQNAFADGLRGLQVYGGNIIRQESLTVGSFT